MIDTGAEMIVEDKGEESDDNDAESTSDLTGKSQTSSLTETTEDEQEQQKDVSTVIKGKTRKRTREDRMESMMTAVVKEVVDSQQKSDIMFLELEEKCMKFEAEQKKEEREFQMRMMAMLCGRPTSYLAVPHTPPPGAYDPYGQQFTNNYN